MPKKAAAPAATDQHVPTMLKVSDLMVDDSNVRTINRGSAPDLLVNSIKEQGILYPLIVRPCADLYQVIDGSMRLHAAVALNMTEVPCIISESANTLTSLMANISSTPMDTIEIYLAYQALVRDGVSKAAIEQVLKPDDKAKAVIHAFGKLIPEMREAALKRCFDVHTLREIARIPPAGQKHLARFASENGYGHEFVGEIRSYFALEGTPAGVANLIYDAYVDLNGKVERSLFGDEIKFLQPNKVAEAKKMTLERILETFPEPVRERIDICPVLEHQLRDEYGEPTDRYRVYTSAENDDLDKSAQAFGFDNYDAFDQANDDSALDENADEDHWDNLYEAISVYARALTAGPEGRLALCFSYNNYVLAGVWLPVKAELPASNGDEPAAVDEPAEVDMSHAAKRRSRNVYRGMAMASVDASRWEAFRWFAWQMVQASYMPRFSPFLRIADRDWGASESGAETYVLPQQSEWDRMHEEGKLTAAFCESAPFEKLCELVTWCAMRQASKGMDAKDLTGLLSFTLDCPDQLYDAVAGIEERQAWLNQFKTHQIEGFADSIHEDVGKLVRAQSKKSDKVASLAKCMRGHVTSISDDARVAANQTLPMGLEVNVADQSPPVAEAAE